MCHCEEFFRDFQRFEVKFGAQFLEQLVGLKLFWCNFEYILQDLWLLGCLLGYPVDNLEETSDSCILTALPLEKLLFWTAAWADEVILKITRHTCV